MLRDALKDALLDLKSQLRGRKASAYVLKIEAEREDAKDRKDSDEDDKDKRPAKRSGASKTSEAVSEGMEALREEMKSFMTKPKSKVSTRNAMPLPIGPSKAAPAMDSKAKGKAK